MVAGGGCWFNTDGVLRDRPGCRGSSKCAPSSVAVFCYPVVIENPGHNCFSSTFFQVWKAGGFN